MITKLINFLRDQNPLIVGATSILLVVTSFLLVVLTYLGVILSRQANTIAQQANTLAELQALKSPKLVYQVTRASSLQETVDIEAARRKAENEIIEAIVSRVQSNPSETYADALDAVLPISVTTPFIPSNVSVHITNQGNNIATQIRVAISIEALIENIEISTIELSKITQGGEGKTSVTIEIDRLLPDESATVTVSHGLGRENSYTTLVARRQPDPRTMSFSDPLVEGLNAVHSESTRVQRYVGTTMEFYLYEPITDSSPNVEVTSNEVTGKEVQSSDFIYSEFEYLKTLVAPF